MKVFKYIATSVAVATVLWVGPACIINYCLEKATPGYMDTNSPVTKIFYGRDGYASSIYARLPLMHDGKKVILIGSSNTRLAFLPKVVSEGLDGIPVSDTAASGGRARMEQKYLDLAYQSVPKSSWSKTTFVVSLDYMKLIHPDGKSVTVPQRNSKGGYSINYVRQPNSFRQLILLSSRFGLMSYNEPRSEITANLPFKLMRVALFAMTPQFLFNRIWGDQIEYVHFWKLALQGRGKRFIMEDTDYSNYRLTPDARYNCIMLRRAAGNISKKEFRILVDMAREVQKKGGHLVFLDLALPSWHRSAVPAFAVYQKTKGKWFDLLKKKYDADVISMQGQVPDDYFRDDVHPKPSKGVFLSKLLAEKLKPVLKS